MVNKITPALVKHMALLANMAVNKSELKNLSQGFQSTLDTFKVLKQLDTRAISGTDQVTGLTNIFRPDKIDRARILTQKQALSQAKKTYQGYFVVPAIFDET